MDREVELIALHLTLGSSSLLRKELERGTGSMEGSPSVREPAALYDARASYLFEQTNGQRERAQSILARLREKGATVISCNDTLYPAGLREHGAFPPLLYAMGNIELLRRRSVAICGSRHASPEGLEHALAFGRVAAEAQLCVVSGYAQGVDRLAHLGAIRSCSSTIIVLAEGILWFRIGRDFKEIDDLWDRVLVISQFPPEQTWRAYTAMERNKVICGLARGLVVVEAREKGGTLAAGRECLRQKKPLWVIQYSSPREDIAGNGILLREGAIGIRTLRQLRSALTSLAES